jgi:hypothetical protein
MTTVAHTFLFDAMADGMPSHYGSHCDPAFLRALSNADVEGATASQVFRGDALLSKLCAKTTAVSSTEKGSSHTKSYDMELYRTILWDLADALSVQWHSIDEETFPLILGNKPVHCITLPTLAIQFRSMLDKHLKDLNGYLGSIEIDLGNPIQRSIFIDCLIKDAVISNGQVIMELGFEGDADTVFHGAQNFQPGGLKLVPYGELDALRPPIFYPASLSKRGQVSLDRYNGKQAFSLQERVLAALASSNLRNEVFAFEAQEKSCDVLQSELPEAKFVKYLLNANHENNKGKAKFYKEVLGIGPDDWRYLAAQFHDGLKSAKLVEVGMKNFNDTFGASFNAMLPVCGLNGRTAMIDTNWIMEPGSRPRLSTAVPATKQNRTNNESTMPPIVSGELSGDAKWEEIFSMAADAGAIAAANAVPTPMKLDGFPVEMEGKCGGAIIRVLDARRGFARWVIKSGNGSRHYYSGAQMFARIDNSQSVDRARAYAIAFATVLQHNGIECEIESYLS